MNRWPKMAFPWPPKWYWAYMPSTWSCMPHSSGGSLLRSFGWSVNRFAALTRLKSHSKSHARVPGTGIPAGTRHNPKHCIFCSLIAPKVFRILSSFSFIFLNLWTLNLKLLTNCYLFSSCFNIFRPLSPISHLLLNLHHDDNSHSNSYGHWQLCRSP